MLASPRDEHNAALHIIPVTLEIAESFDTEAMIELAPLGTGLGVEIDGERLPVRLFCHGSQTGGRLEWSGGRVHLAAALVDRALPENAIEIRALGSRGAFYAVWPHEPAPAEMASRPEEAE